MCPQSCLSFSMHSLLYMTQQFLVGTSKVKRNCSYTCQQSAHMRAWERGYNLPLICLHFLLLIGFYFSKVHESSALRNLCCASMILSIHTLKNTLSLNCLYIQSPLYLSHLSILSVLDYLLLKLTLHETIFTS